MFYTYTGDLAKEKINIYKNMLFVLISLKKLVNFCIYFQLQIENNVKKFDKMKWKENKQTFNERTNKQTNCVCFMNVDTRLSRSGSPAGRIP